MGIAYAAPDMQGGNFWGVINHDNEEGIFRIADNTVTRGLKMWTWGFPSFTNETDPRKDPNQAAALHRIMGGRVGPVFPQRRISRARRSVDSGNLQPDRRHEQRDACEREHADQSLGRGSDANLQFFSIEPATPLRVTLKRGEAVLFDDAVTADPKNGNRISAAIPAGGSGEQVQLTIRTAEGKELIAAETKIK